MAEISHALRGRQEYSRVQLAAATESEIEYYLFPGDIFLRIGTTNFDAAWGWVPVLGFGLRLCEAVNVLSNQTVSRVAYTESDEHLHLQRTGTDVAVMATYARGLEVVPLTSLADSARRFLTVVYEELTTAFPALGENDELRQRVHRAAPSDSGGTGQ